MRVGAFFREDKVFGEFFPVILRFVDGARKCCIKLMGAVQSLSESSDFPQRKC